MLDAGALPVEELSLLASREARRPRAIYQAHKWFARRFGSAFRGLLTASVLPADADFWTAYYQGADMHGKTVLDPFVGGGTSVVEAQRLGAHVIGVDVDAVACAITRFETRAAETPDLLPALARLKRNVAERLTPYYHTTLGDGTLHTVVHYFWVQVVECLRCSGIIEAHPHFQLAYEAEGDRQWAFCRYCHHVEELDRTRKTLKCMSCDRRTVIQKGTVTYGVLTCPRCRAQERLIDVASRTGRPPTWHLFAIETIDDVTDPRAGLGGRSVPLSRRVFRTATDVDRAVFEQAERSLRQRAHDDGSMPYVPNRLIPADNRTDDRLVRYGYRRYQQLFNARQLLHLSVLAEEISKEDESLREALGLAFSDHLSTNCMLTNYAFGWRRLAPLFSVRAFRHVSRPVELNPWLDGTGRGTFPNAVRAVQKAAGFAREPKEPILDGGFRPCPTPVRKCGDVTPTPTVAVLHRSAEDLGGFPDRSVDLVLTDPPYFDNIAYSELSNFFLPWLQLLGLAQPDGVGGPNGMEVNLAAKTRGAAAVQQFGDALTTCLRETARVLKPEGRLVFTFQHQTAGAWVALGTALAAAGLRPIQLFPLLGDGRVGLHEHAGNSRWDAVFVAAVGQSRPDAGQAEPLRLSVGAHRAALAHCEQWADRLRSNAPRFEEADVRNFRRASLVAGALGLFPTSEQDSMGYLETLLGEDYPCHT